MQNSKNNDESIHNEGFENNDLVENRFIKSEKISWNSFSKNGILIHFGGIIYNRKEIFPFHDVKSDAESILDSYQSMGNKAFYQIHGKVTVLIFDKEKTVVFRDQWGEGPMVFYKGGFFADSMDGILSMIKDEPVIDPISLNSFMKYGFIPAPLTIVKGISIVPAGHVLLVENSTEKLVHLFDLKEFKNGVIKIDLETALVEYDRLLKQSIRRRIEGSNSVGILLSGGYDSGGNIAVLREVFDGSIKSFSIGFRDNPFSELPYAKLMADKFGAEHHEYLMDQNDIEYLPDAVMAFGQPFSESGFMLNNAAMRFVKDENLPVIIGGDGNDQLFGTTGKELALHHLMKSTGLIYFQKLFSAISSNSFFENDNLLYKLRFHNQKILNVMRPDNFGFNNSMMHTIFKNGAIEEHPVFQSIPKSYSDFSNLHDLHNLHLDIRHSINEVILNKASRLSAYYGNNLTYSYLDRDIYDFLKKLPLELRLKGTIKEIAKGRGTTKYLHKAYTKPKLPSDVTSRKKQGGFSPLAIFFKNENYREKIFKYIINSTFASEYLNEMKLREFFREYEKNAVSDGYWFWYKQLKSNQLINLLIMVLWCDIYVNNRRYSTLSEYLDI